MEIEECLSAIVSVVNNDIARQKPDEQTKWPTMEWAYDYGVHVAGLIFVKPTATTDAFEYIFDISKAEEAFWQFFNVAPDDRARYVTSTRATGVYGFPNVWNRRDLYIHASFVNYTAYGYLGRDGEFYPKPSKIYQFDWQPMQFFFEVSYDGMTPVKLPYERFEVELSFIIDDKRYQSQ
jgi:hypothetical protein